MMLKTFLLADSLQAQTFRSGRHEPGSGWRIPRSSPRFDALDDPAASPVLHRSFRHN